MSPALDEVWFDRYYTIKTGIGEAYEMLEPLPTTLAVKHAEFIASNHRVSPSLLSDRVNIGDYETHVAELVRLRDDIETIEQNQLVKQAYGASIDELIATAKMIIAGATGDAVAFDTANEAIYDKPDEHIFKAACHWIRTDAANSLASGNITLAKYADRVLELIPDVHDEHQILIPSEDTFQKVRAAHQRKHGYYELLFGTDGMTTMPYITQAEGDEICKHVLTNIGATDWKVVPAENNLWAVMRSRKELVRPSGYRLDRDEFIGIVCHEIGSHIIEEINGQKLPLKLLGGGLAGFEKGNEGRAFLREQIVYESERTFLNQFAWEYIVLLHLSTSLTQDLHKQPYTFVELYETLEALYSFWREKRMPTATNNREFAELEAWYLAVRIMKGTNGTSRGYMKDSVYLEGNIRCWQLAAKDPDAILRGDSGMFDITNAEHVKIVESLMK